jgi:hypothetical protein
MLQPDGIATQGSQTQGDLAEVLWEGVKLVGRLYAFNERHFLVVDTPSWLILELGDLPAIPVSEAGAADGTCTQLVA